MYEIWEEYKYLILGVILTLVGVTVLSFLPKSAIIIIFIVTVVFIFQDKIVSFIKDYFDNKKVS